MGGQHGAAHGGRGHDQTRAAPEQQQIEGRRRSREGTPKARDVPGFPQSHVHYSTAVSAGLAAFTSASSSNAHTILWAPLSYRGSVSSAPGHTAPSTASRHATPPGLSIDR